MTTLYLLCGLPGSGKTTQAKELNAAGQGILLSGDDWICRLYPDDAEAAARDERRDLVEALQWDVAALLLTAGSNVILDWGVWARAERDSLRDRAQAVGAEVQMIFVDAPLDVLHERVATRNQDLPPGTFRISPEELNTWATQFEAPTPDELT